MDKTLIERAIESAKNRQYKLSADLERNISENHRTKAKKQKEVAEVTVTALERMLPKNWIAEDMGDCEIAWVCPACRSYWALMDGTPLDNEYRFCPKCGQRLEL